MATQTVEFRAASGLTLTVRLFAVGSDTIVQTASSCTEATNRKGTYAAVFTDPGASEFELVALSGTTPVARWFTTLTLTTATFQAYEVRAAGLVARVTANTDQWGGVTVTGMPLPTASYVAPDNATIGSISTNLVTVNNNVLSRLAASSYVAPLSASETRSALGLASANLDTQLGDIPTVAEFEARTLLAAGYASSTHWTSTRAGYLDSVLLAANSNRTVQVTGSNHVAADIHELQPAVITSAAFATGWLTAAGTAADYITELQTALGTATNQTAILDRVSFALSALAGACSDAQTAAETYVLNIGGNTYTVDYSGLDASGNRGTTTLTKA